MSRRTSHFLNQLQSHLHKPDNIEFMLLKGHLVLEQALNEILLGHIDSENNLRKLSSSFSKKIDLLDALRGGKSENTVLLREINRIRNKLAHQLDFKEFHPELKAWACEVLGYVPKTLDRNRTYVNTLSKAFYWLCGELIGEASAIQSFKATKKLNPPI